MGWSGGYAGTENPLTVTNVTSDLTITANFAMDQVACGSRFEVDADAVDLVLFHRKPKVWREYTVPPATAIKHQAMKVVKPTVDNTDFLDNKGKPTYMDPATGESKVIVIVPAKDPKGDLNGTVVLENGVGMAAFDISDP